MEDEIIDGFAFIDSHMEHNQIIEPTDSMFSEPFSQDFLAFRKNNESLETTIPAHEFLHSIYLSPDEVVYHARYICDGEVTEEVLALFLTPVYQSILALKNMILPLPNATTSDLPRFSHNYVLDIGGEDNVSQYLKTSFMSRALSIKFRLAFNQHFPDPKHQKLFKKLSDDWKKVAAELLKLAVDVDSLLPSVAWPQLNLILTFAGQNLRRNDLCANNDDYCSTEVYNILSSFPQKYRCSDTEKLTRLHHELNVHEDDMVEDMTPFAFPSPSTPAVTYQQRPAIFSFCKLMLLLLAVACMAIFALINAPILLLQGGCLAIQPYTCLSLSTVLSKPSQVLSLIKEKQTMILTAQDEMKMRQERRKQRRQLNHNQKEKKRENSKQNEKSEELQTMMASPLIPDEFHFHFAPEDNKSSPFTDSKTIEEEESIDLQPLHSVRIVIQGGVSYPESGGESASSQDFSSHHQEEFVQVPATSYAESTSPSTEPNASNPSPTQDFVQNSFSTTTTSSDDEKKSSEHAQSKEDSNRGSDSYSDEYDSGFFDFDFDFFNLADSTWSDTKAMLKKAQEESKVLMEEAQKVIEATQTDADAFWEQTRAEANQLFDEVNTHWKESVQPVASAFIEEAQNEVLATVEKAKKEAKSAWKNRRKHAKKAWKRIQENMKFNE